MTLRSEHPESISDVIDRIEKIREELLALQRSLEKMEGEPPVPPHDSGHDAA
ncbi:MAG: hypothetical protein H0X25_10520 [Acidobacteriales bacterium]|nr:hypothetical protein [Terriglobales bacterium]